MMVSCLESCLSLNNHMSDQSIVANLPGEISHLFEEALAKQHQMDGLNQIIGIKDNLLQRHIKMNGSLVKHAKEDAMTKDILSAFDTIENLHKEKIAFVQKAFALLDRHVKRLDVKIRQLQNEGSMPLDHRMPSLLRASEGNLVAANSSLSSGTNTPLQPISANVVGSNRSSLANDTMNRLHQAAAASATGSAARSGSATTSIHPLHQTVSALSGAANSTPTSAGASNIARTREMSAGSDLKKRKLNLGPLPTPNLIGATRHASLGPGTPKATTPGGSRAGSVGPRPGALKKPGNLRKPLVQTLTRKQHRKGAKKPLGPRRLIAGSRASPATTTGDELSADADSASEDELASQDGSDAKRAAGTRPKRHGNTKHHANGVEDVEMEEAADDTKYCYCQDVSHGDMIACDNADCAIQWFHWTCAGITSEPTGEWLCNDCRRLPRDKIKKQ